MSVMTDESAAIRPSIKPTTNNMCWIRNRNILQLYEDKQQSFNSVLKQNKHCNSLQNKQ